jgi:nucleoside-diphosphate-sugar epimerase
MSHLLCIGLGYSAAALARRLAPRGWQITGTSRSEEGAGALAAIGARGLIFSGETASHDVAAAIRVATHVLVSIPPAETGDPALRHHARDLAESAALAWIGYLSTVGVYGDHAGGWVDETTPARPATQRSRWRLQAECEWRALGRQSGKRVHVFRLPGIYGPGRSAIEALRAGTARRIVKPGQVFNRIHVADIALALDHAIHTRAAPEILNVSDDEPAPPEDVVAFAAQLLGVPVPPAIAFNDAQLSPMARSFYSESKRVSNALMKSSLRLSLTYPTYREGLTAIASQLR